MSQKANPRLTKLALDPLLLACPPNLSQLKYHWSSLLLFDQRRVALPLRSLVSVLGRHLCLEATKAEAPPHVAYVAPHADTTYLAPHLAYVAPHPDSSPRREAVVETLAGVPPTLSTPSPLMMSTASLSDAVILTSGVPMPMESGVRLSHADLRLGRAHATPTSRAAGGVSKVCEPPLTCLFTSDASKTSRRPLNQLLGQSPNQRQCNARPQPPEP